MLLNKKSDTKGVSEKYRTVHQNDAFPLPLNLAFMEFIGLSIDAGIIRSSFEVMVPARELDAEPFIE